VGDSIFQFTIEGGSDVWSAFRGRYMAKECFVSMNLNTDSSLSGKSQAKVIRRPDGDTKTLTIILDGSGNDIVRNNEVVHKEGVVSGPGFGK